MLRSIIRVVVASAIVAIVFAGCASTPSRPKLSRKQKAVLLLQVADGALVEGDPTGALGTLMQARKLAPQMAEVHHSMALAYYAKRDFKDALKEVKLAHQLAPTYPDIENSLGKILVDVGQYGEAKGPLLSAAQNPLYREAYKSWTNLGILYYREGNYEKAGKQFERAINLDRQNACIAFYYRGHLRLRVGDYAAAIRDYTEATKRACAGFADAHLAIGITYERAKQYDLARRSFLSVEQRFPDSRAADEAIRYLRSIP